MEKTIIDSYNELVPIMNKLAKEGKDLWEFHDSSSGYGFKLIEEKFYIETRVATNYGDEESSFTIVKRERNGNIFSILDKDIANVYTIGKARVYDIIKGMLE